MNPEELLGMRILIVDDEPVNIALLEDILQLSGYTQLESTSDARRVRGFCQQRRPDLILLDLNMPHLDGFAVMKQLSQDFEPTDCVPYPRVDGRHRPGNQTPRAGRRRDGFPDQALRSRRGAAADQEPPAHAPPALAAFRPEATPGGHRARTHLGVAPDAGPTPRGPGADGRAGTPQRARLDDGGHRARFQQRPLAHPRLQRDAHAQPPAARRHPDGRDVAGDDHLRRAGCREDVRPAAAIPSSGRPGTHAGSGSTSTRWSNRRRR